MCYVICKFVHLFDCSLLLYIYYNENDWYKSNDIIIITTQGLNGRQTNLDDSYMRTTSLLVTMKFWISESPGLSKYVAIFPFILFNKPKYSWTQKVKTIYFTRLCMGLNSQPCCIHLDLSLTSLDGKSHWSIQSNTTISDTLGSADSTASDSSGMHSLPP